MKFIEKNELPIYDGTQEYCLWLGCMGAYDPVGTRDRAVAGEGAAASQHHLRRAAQGALQWRSGAQARQRSAVLATGRGRHREREGERQDQTALHLPALRPHHRDGLEGIRPDFRNRTSHASCWRATRRSLPAIAGGKEKVVYHDPCYLGRYRGTYDAPREVLSRNAEVVEAPKNRERSFCCGAGGGMMFLGEEKGERVNMTRAKELVATGATTVGTACPFCQSMFKDALKSVSQDPPKLLDVVQITAASLEKTP